MAKFDTDGLAQLSMSFSEIEAVPDELFEDMLNAEADVVEAAQRQKAAAYLSGKYSTGKNAAAITRSKMKFGKSGRVMHIYPKGSRHRGNTTTREAEIAFINEFGKRGQPARPFIRDANEQSIEYAVNAAERVYDNFLKSKNL